MLYTDNTSLNKLPEVRAERYLSPLRFGQRNGASLGDAYDAALIHGVV